MCFISFHEKQTPCQGFSTECLLCDGAMTCSEYLMNCYPKEVEDSPSSEKYLHSKV